MSTRCPPINYGFFVWAPHICINKKLYEMRKFIPIILLTILISCGKDDSATQEELMGTWILDTVLGECSGLPIDASADVSGCFDVPLIEVNCAIVEFNGDGTLQYAYNFIKGEGEYTINGDVINICTDRCLDYNFNGTELTLQTGTIPLCDPIYTFTRSSNSLDNILSSNRRTISKVFKNGQLSRSYDYNSDQSLQSLKFYDEDGNIEQIYTYQFEPFKTIVILNHIQLGLTTRIEYYDEGIDRLRRDSYNTSNQLANYQLYFYNEEDCWIDRRERYTPNHVLLNLYDYEYLDSGCDREITKYNSGQKENVQTIRYDNNPYWGTSGLLNIFRYKEIYNIVSYTILENNVVSTSSSYNSVYTYGPGGFPEIETRTYFDGTIDTYTYQY